MMKWHNFPSGMRVFCQQMCSDWNYVNTMHDVSPACDFIDFISTSNTPVQPKHNYTVQLYTSKAWNNHWTCHK